jgi:small subunit ribosomal protein S18
MEEETTTPAQAENTPAAPQPEGRAPERSSAPRVRKDDDDGGGPRKMVSVGGGKDARGRGRRRRKVSYLTINKIYTIDYKDVSLLRRFVNEQGKIVSSRQSGATAKEQRMISTAIRRAREMALLPFVMIDTSANERRPHSDRRPPRGGRDYRGEDSQQQSREYRGDDSPARETQSQVPPSAPEAAAQPPAEPAAE